VVVCDITRPVPNAQVVPPVLDALDAAEVQEVTILIATGTHRPNLGDEIVQLLGPEVPQRASVVNHVCTDDASLRDLGVSPNGVPIHLNTLYLDADVKVTVGMIEPHFMAGFAGGRKMVMPGIAGLKTVQAWHSPRFLEHPNATNGIVDGNPVHEESLAIAKLAPPDLILDTALDSKKQPCGIFAGDMEAAWRAGVEFVRGNVAATVPEPVDIVVTSGGGYPLDLTFYQAVKGMVAALPILKPGGTVVIASACDEGIGNPHFAATLFGCDDIERFVETISDPAWIPVPDQWQVEEFAKARRGRKVRMVARGIPEETLSRLFVIPHTSVEDAIAAALEDHGPDAKIAVIPKGPYVLPSVK
ncbi:nickel-dependent lactate racemase, partial [bacterium]